MILPHRLTKALQIIAVLTTLTLVLAYIDTNYGSVPEVRLDSGDFRWRGRVFASLPERLRPDDRAALLAASRELGIRSAWCRLARGAPSNADIGSHNYLYSHTAAWLRIERPLGKLVLSQLADHLQHPGVDVSPSSPLAVLPQVHWDPSTHRYELGFLPDSDSGALHNTLSVIGYVPDPNGELADFIAGRLPDR